MPDDAQENAFVETFILPEKRERYAQLLANPKRRKTILDRLHHNLDYIPELARQIPSNQHNAEGILRLLREHSINPANTVYILSASREIDGLMLPVAQALEEVFQAGGGSVLCWTEGKLAYYHPEEPASGCILTRPHASQNTEK